MLHLQLIERLFQWVLESSPWSPRKLKIGLALRLFECHCHPSLSPSTQLATLDHAIGHVKVEDHIALLPLYTSHVGTDSSQSALHHQH